MPRMFENYTVIFEDQDFTIAYGHFEESPAALATRWGGRGAWTMVHRDLTDGFLKSLIGAKGTKHPALFSVLSTRHPL